MQRARKGKARRAQDGYGKLHTCTFARLVAGRPDVFARRRGECCVAPRVTAVLKLEDICRAGITEKAEEECKSASDRAIAGANKR